MTPQDIVKRARSAIGYGTVYRLGRGGRRPTAGVPWDDAQMCDCSGFCCWCLGIDRYQPLSTLYRKLSGGWVYTGSMVRDAALPRSQSGFFTQVELPRFGCLVVFPAHATVKIGHCGIVSSVTSEFDFRVIHCSSGNRRRTGDAIRETDGGIFLRNGAIFATFDPAVPDQDPVPA